MLRLTILFHSKLDIFPGEYQNSETTKQFSKPWEQFKNQSLQYLIGQKPKVWKPCIHKQCQVENGSWHSAILIAQSITNFCGKPELCPNPINSN